MASGPTTRARLVLLLLHSIWAQSGGQKQPSLTARPSSVVSQGASVTLRCLSHDACGSFKLYKEDGGHSPELARRIFQKDFRMGPVTPAHAGTYTCRCINPRSTYKLSAPSKPLRIVVTGVHRKPSLLAHPSALVRSGGRLALLCRSEITCDDFILHREGAAEGPRHVSGQLQDRLWQASFSVGPVTAAHAGTYTCYCSLRGAPHVWSAPSDPLRITVTGLHPEPSLSAQPGPVVRPGDNVTFSCRSQSSFALFHLSREGGAPRRWRTGAQSHHGAFQGRFPLGPATPAHGGTYRCYGSLGSSEHSWSLPSDPLHLSVSGDASSDHPGPTEPSSSAGNASRDYTETTAPSSDTGRPPPPLVPAVLGVSGSALAVLLGLLAHRRCLGRKSAAGRDGEPGEARAASAQEPEAEAPGEVTYAQLDPCVFTRGKLTSASPRPAAPSTASCEYAALAAR